MKNKLLILTLLTLTAVVVGVYAAALSGPRVKQLRPEIRAFNYLSRQPGRPPMPWPPEGVSAGVISYNTNTTTLLLDDTNHAYPSK